MKTIIFNLKRFGLLSIVLLIIASTLHAADSISSMRSVFEKSLTKIESKHAKSKKQILAIYSSDLAKIESSYKNSGNLEGLLAARKEMARFKKEKTFLKEIPEEYPSEIVQLNAKTKEIMDSANYDKNKNIVDLADRYTAHLQKTKMAMTREDKIAEAMAAKAEQDKVNAFPAVTAAKFILAELEAKNNTPAQPEPAEEAPTTPTAASSTEPVKTTVTASSSRIRTVMRSCSACEAEGKIPEKCPSCSGSGDCAPCEGQGKRKSNMRGSNTLSICFTCRGLGKCKPCNGKMLTGKMIDCEKCSGKGKIAVPVYVSSYTPDQTTMLAYANVNNATTSRISLREAMDDYRSRIGIVIESQVTVRRSSSSRYVYLRDASQEQTSYGSYSFIPVNASVREEFLTAATMAGENGVITVRYTFQANGRRFLLSSSN